MRILCLANSIREGGRCVAGIDYATGRWVRPVLLGGGPIPVERTFVGNKYLEPGDVVEIEVDQTPTPMPFQMENHVVYGRPWRIVGYCAAGDCLHLCDSTEPLLHNRSDRVATEYFDDRGIEEWRSLQLLHPPSVHFQRDPHKAERWRPPLSTGGRGTRSGSRTRCVPRSWTPAFRSAATAC